MYVDFLTKDVRDRMHELTDSFQAYTISTPMEYDYYELVNRVYLRKVLALIRENIKAYVKGEPVSKFFQEIDIDSDRVTEAENRAKGLLNAKLIKPVEYLGEIAAALAYELNEKQEETK